MPRVTLRSAASCCSADSAFPSAPVSSPGPAPPGPFFAFFFSLVVLSPPRSASLRSSLGER
eukprot:5184775-Prymnesium_polylepis.1